MPCKGDPNAIDALRKLKRVSMAHLPTPVEPLDRLSAALGGPRIWMKRDDCTGLATGGNKTRKIEFLMADAVAKGADTVVTVGAIQSNHARQVAAASARLGLRCVLGLLDAVPDRSQVYRLLGNVFLDKLFDAEIRISPDLEDTEPLLDSIADELSRQGRQPYVIPLGGSNGLGAAAYAEAFLELLAQFEALQEPLNAIVVPIVSGGTLAGLLLGASLSGWRGTMIGISASDKAERAIQRVRVPQLAAAEILGASDEIIGQPPIVIDDRFVGKGYGIPTPECVQAIELLARKEGLLLDPVYTGKAMAGLLTLIRENYFQADVNNLLFWHTGGSVALHAYPEIAVDFEKRTSRRET
ncbi:MAG: D-cysteine desulfhydrase family protein [Verrucomicrobia bacterium]|nr:D-cysteine desulfhydrase family protein [Verrucomicrobiota bacterium]